jgi:pimeloyl-ACP methyl ester carboxylesterase
MLLVHGFPTASQMFRDLILIPRLSDRFHVVASDFPGFGQSDMPSRNGFSYTFAKIADVIERFAEIAGLDRYAMYIFDYGSPIGCRLAIKHPERVTGIISQNSNAYEEGLSDSWNPTREYCRQLLGAVRTLSMTMARMLEPEPQPGDIVIEEKAFGINPAEMA